MKNKFEYKRLSTTCQNAGIEEMLDNFGKEGWEIIWYEERNQPKEVSHIKTLMKRLKSKVFLS